MEKWSCSLWGAEESMAIKETIWQIEPHTQAKHAILENYLKAWLPIMSRITSRILYVDGFAGPGKYLDDRGAPTIDGSPIIAINAARKHRLPLKAEIIFIFIEARRDRYEYLKNLLEGMNLPENMKHEVIKNKFDETLSSILNDLDEQKKILAPAFAFIDPFGYSDTPFTVIKRIMGNPMCEVLINFMYCDVNRFLKDPVKARHFDSLFGTDGWREIATLRDPKERKTKTCRLYQKQLEKEANIKYVRFFEMLNKLNETEYFLFFGTNNIEGLKKMKYAMWRVDPTGTFRFSDRTDPKQIVLFKAEPDYNLLKRLIIAHFGGKEASIEQIEEFVVTETPFRETHYKRHILRLLEEVDKIKVVNNRKRRRGTYPGGTVVRFLVQRRK